MIVDNKLLEQVTVETIKARAYVLLRTRNGDSEQAVATVQRQPGVVMLTRLKGWRMSSSQCKLVIARLWPN